MEAIPISNMNFKGGVLIIGSLLWEETLVRTEWRERYLKPRSAKVAVPVRIRYGRESKINRKGTYSMVFSNHPSTDFGQAFVVEFADLIHNCNNLEEQAYALAHAEEIATRENRTLNKNWGTIGLLLNPGIDHKDKVSADLIRFHWAKLYDSFKGTFTSEAYRIDKEVPVIDQGGFLTIEWVKEMDDFDLLIATPVVPEPKVLLTSKMIADKMNEKRYSTYFENNLKEGIKTFQDNEILKQVKSE